MKNKLVLILCFVLFCSHDMFLKMDTYFVTPNEETVIKLYNGTFDKSENTIDRDRMLDVSLVGNGTRTKVADDQWTEKDSITLLHFTTGETGTWVAGVSTKPRNIEMNAEDFNNYLENDGVKDMLSSRKESNKLNQNAIEKYSKHVKTIFQVGDVKTEDWNTVLGYPIEFVPLSNPYLANTGDQIQVKLLSNGKPLANQLVYVDYKSLAHGHSHDESEGHSHDSDKNDSQKELKEHKHGTETNVHTHETKTHSHDSVNEHSHDNGKKHSHETKEHSHSHDETTHTHGNEDETTHNHDKKEKGNHDHTSGQELRTNDKGVLTVNLTEDGIWFLRTIHLIETRETGLTHESNWATLTFEVTHSHDNAQGDNHTHEEEGLHSYVFWIGSIILLAGLFFFFNRKK